MNKKNKRLKNAWLKKLEKKLYFLTETDCAELIDNYAEQIDDELKSNLLITDILLKFSIDQIAQDAYGSLTSEQKIAIINRKKSAMTLFGEILSLPWVIILVSPFIMLFLMMMPLAFIGIYVSEGAWYGLRIIVAWITRIFKPNNRQADKIKRSSFLKFPFNGKRKKD